MPLCALCVRANLLRGVNNCVKNKKRIFFNSFSCLVAFACFWLAFSPETSKDMSTFSFLCRSHYSLWFEDVAFYHFLFSFGQSTIHYMPNLNLTEEAMLNKKGQNVYKVTENLILTHVNFQKTPTKM